MRTLLVALLLLASPAVLAQEHRGVYLGAGGGGRLQIPAGGSGRFGYDVEARLGVSLDKSLQLYLSGATGADSYGAPFTHRASQVLVNVQHFFFLDESFGVYGRGGLGLGIADGVAVPASATAPGAAYGISEVLGLGFELRLSRDVSLAPEVLFRRINETDTSRIDALAFTLSLVAY